MAVTASQVKELREKTGAGMMDCKAALDLSGGDFEGAIRYLREKGLATAAKRAGKVAAEGVITARHRGGGRKGVPRIHASSARAPAMPVSRAG